jgi:hypothetical protein
VVTSLLANWRPCRRNATTSSCFPGFASKRTSRLPVRMLTPFHSVSLETSSGLPVNAIGTAASFRFIVAIRVECGFHPLRRTGGVPSSKRVCPSSKSPPDAWQFGRGRGGGAAAEARPSAWCPSWCSTRTSVRNCLRTAACGQLAAESCLKGAGLGWLSRPY